jgi:cytoskeleton protein RodZ
VAPIAVAAAAVRADQPEPSRLAAGPEGESPPAAAGAAEANGLERLWVEAREDCWVSVSDRRGHVLGRDLLKGGVARTYVGAGPLHVMLGNSTAVTVRVNDVPVDLAPYQRHRVAHLTLPDIRRPAAQPVASME